MPRPMNSVGMVIARRWGTLAFGAALSCSVACSSNAPDAKTPDDARSDPAGEGSVSDPLPRPLPRYLTLEVRADGVWIGGELLAGQQLLSRLREGARDVENQGAAVIFYSADNTAAVLRTLAEAGFSHVVISGLSAEGWTREPTAALDPESRTPSVEESTDEAAAPSDETTSSPTPSSEEPAAAAPSAAQEPPPDDVMVKHYGLHIGGGPNDDATREKYLEPIAQRFDALRRCHVLAKNRKLQASFGVDLELPHDGGRAKIADYRTSLKGQEFHMCVLETLGAVSFPGAGRAMVVSYSVLFKPQR